jgi:hypothetical protein
MIVFECGSCGLADYLELPLQGPSLCPRCGRIITKVSVDPWMSQIKHFADKMASVQSCGLIHSRKQVLSTPIGKSMRKAMQGN